MNPGTTFVSNVRSGDINLSRIDNGYAVSFSRETKKLAADGNSFLYDYETKRYAFSTLEEAVAKVQELGAIL